MTDIGLVVFTGNEKIIAAKKEGHVKSLVRRAFLKTGKLLHRCGFYKTAFGTWLFYLSHKKYFSQPNELVKVSDNLEFQIIRLPLNIEELSGFNGTYLEKLVNRNIAVNNIKYCHIPSTVKDRGFFKNFDSCPNYEGLLLKLLLDPIVANIYSKRADRIGDLEILFLAGEDRAETYEAIRLLEPQIRYVTVAAGNKEEVESETENIFGDSGLSISVVGDYKSALKHADLILNFDKELPFLSKIKLKPQAIVFNLADADLTGAFSEKTVIYGLVPDLPKELTSRLGMRIMQYYTRRELASLLIARLSGLSEEYPFTYDSSLKVKTDFGHYGFRIAGLKGKYGVLRLDALQKYAAGPAPGN